MTYLETSLHLVDAGLVNDLDVLKVYVMAWMFMLVLLKTDVSPLSCSLSLLFGFNDVLSVAFSAFEVACYMHFFIWVSITSI